jgi:transcriptional regulator with XRE-family HTH domain
MFIFTKETAQLLKKIRKRAGLSQKEMAIRMSIKTKFSQSLIT